MFYKMHLMINHAVTRAGAEQILEQIAEKIASFGGKVSKKVMGDIIKLETLIKKSDTAHYAFVVAEIPADKVKELSYELNVIEGVDRVLVLKADSATAEQATFPVISEKDYRKRPLDFWKSSITVENPSILKFFLTPRGKIFARKLVLHFIGHEYPAIMRQLSIAVKQARYMGWLRLK